MLARLSRGAALLVAMTLAGVAFLLIVEGIPGILAQSTEVESGKSFLPYVWPLVYGTLLAAAIALAIAVPTAVGVALFVSHYAPRQLGQLFGYLIDLLAAVPSVVYGLWGMLILAPRMAPGHEWLDEHLGFIPLFAGPASPTGRTILTAGIVLAIMILPIMSAICREIFLQTPHLHEEAALAIGATRWEMARLAIFPHARSGIAAAAVLGLGRALGETIAVAMVLTTSGVMTAGLISSSGPSTIAANIALTFDGATGLSVNALIAGGLVLFVITSLVNLAARRIVERRSELSGPL